MIHEGIKVNRLLFHSIFPLFENKINIAFVHFLTIDNIAWQLIKDIQFLAKSVQNWVKTALAIMALIRFYCVCPHKT